MGKTEQQIMREMEIKRQASNLIDIGRFRDAELFLENNENGMFICPFVIGFRKWYKLEKL